jgi:3-(3-hydroxy-phenyl)propionate hydroxylase
VSVVVVGAGPTGVAAAILLADQGVDVLVLDRFTEVYPRPRAVALDDEVHRILVRLGVGDEFAAISRPTRGMRIVDGELRVLAEIPRANPGVHGFPESSLFDQPELEAVLRAALARRPRARLRGGVEVTGIRAHELADGVSVELTDRATGAAEVLVADWVIGADGANSVVRRAIGAEQADRGFTQHWLVADVVTGADLDRWEGIHQVCSPHRAASFMRIGEDRYRWEFQLRPGERADSYTTVDDLRPLLRPWLRGTPSEDLKLVRLTDYTFQARIADRWRAGRVFLAGDAAHLTPPFIGQGMGAGLRDALNLAWKLAAVVHGRLPESILDTYEQERGPHTAAVIRSAVVLGRIMTGHGPGGAVLRRAVGAGVRRLPAERFASATPPLRRSALVGRGPLAGTLCPHAPLGERTALSLRPSERTRRSLEGGGRAGDLRFDDVGGGRFVLVTGLPMGEGLRRTVERAGVVPMLLEPAEPLGRWLAAGRAHAALVRPDGAVMAAADTVAAALRPLEALRRREGLQ